MNVLNLTGSPQAKLEAMEELTALLYADSKEEQKDQETASDKIVSLIQSIVDEDA